MGNSKVSTDEYGTVRWHNEKGQLHRDGPLPAVEKENGTKEWYQNGQLHRDNDLPAIEGGNGLKQWWIRGECRREGGLPTIE